MKVCTPACAGMLLMMAWLCPSVNAQVLNRQVVAIAGGSRIVNQLQIQYTVGETAITPITDGRMLLTQGFHQPEELPKLPPGGNAVKSYILFPNPAATNVKITFELIAGTTVTLELINTAGQTLHTQLIELGPGKTTVVLPVNHFAAGIYTVMLKMNGTVYFEKLIIQ
ncbi:T9SS type A sorting domain-containing protein [Chitinophaga vietnamensis]|uniref:T9SS type A sorting domain-containing protein n=1 Tax=Chitinophaga vietnamensis TaxID=2593957 RepID=UPI001177D920|nr:T9SS type A sorting domain-containing protein [Chitinophaga vietnamensis]